MTRSTQPRSTFTLSDSILHQLNVYVLGASAAGVGLLALTLPSQAKVVYTRTHHVIGTGGHYNLDVNHDRTTDFQIQQSSTRTLTGFNNNRLLVKQPSGNAVVGYPGNASALRTGAHIGPGQKFVGSARGEDMLSIRQSDSVFYKSYGQWLNVTNRYLGLKFKIHGKTHYGWARLNVVNQGLSVKATLTGYAYETIANKGILAGKTTGSEGVTAPPASLGRLAQGSPGRTPSRPEDH